MNRYAAWHRPSPSNRNRRGNPTLLVAPLLISTLTRALGTHGGNAIMSVVLDTRRSSDEIVDAIGKFPEVTHSLTCSQIQGRKGTTKTYSTDYAKAALTECGLTAMSRRSARALKV